MCLKLKNKILQVIEIISNYGLIFAIYKFILFIIKNLFRVSALSKGGFSMHTNPVIMIARC